jgi:uncharacterized membrane protein YphA (DoxX/SURF4 family)
MFYRVDYVVAVLLAGFLAGILSSKAFERVTTPRLGQGYYVVTAVLLLVRAGLFTCIMLRSQESFWTTSSGIAGDAGGLLFGFLLGVAARRKDARTLLTNPSVVGALCLGCAVTFTLAGVGKAFSMAPMTDFFTQSGYSVTFLRFIVIAEIFGAVGLLLPWAVLPALLGLSVDMFGAVLTHIHNGDPLNDSTGAIGLLIRLTVIGALWELGRRPTKSVPRSILRVGAVALVCLAVAQAGSSMMRHLPAASPAQGSH